LVLPLKESMVAKKASCRDSHMRKTP
jgi:hypothetical protein